ncbi:MAG: DUF58 domain-containing protein [Reyranellaceae bacterium]
MRPTSRALLIVAIAAALALPWALILEAWWETALALPLTALLALALDAALAPASRGVRVEASTPEMLYIGTDGALSVRVAAPAGNIGGGRCVVLPEVSGPLRDLGATSVDWRATAEATADWKLSATRRGEGRLERIWLLWTGPLGLMAIHHRVDIGRVVAAVPDIAAVRQLALKFAQRDAFFGQKPMRQQGDGSEYRALREYVPGFDHRAMDWKTSARHRRLMCKEFYTERNQQVVFAFDTGHLMSQPLGGVPRLDHAINAGLQMAYMSLRAGDRVGVFGFDARVRHYAEPLGNVANFAHVQRQMARLEYRAEESNYTLALMDLMGRLKRRSLIVVMTDFVDSVTAELMIDNLGRLSARHLVLFVVLRDRALSGLVEARPDSFPTLARAVLAQDLMGEREIVLQRLRRLGIQCLETEPARLGIELINRYLEIKRRELL